MTHDTTKSLGQRLYEALYPLASIGWTRLHAKSHSLYEQAAIRFTASLSDADPILAARVEALERALHEIIDLAPATQEVCAASMMADAAREALQPKPADQVSVEGE